MRKLKAIPTWAVVVGLGVGVLVTLACSGKSAKYPTQPPARNLTVSETQFVTAAFSAEPEPDAKRVIFKDESTGNPTRWRWQFGDGRTSFEQNPVHSYPSFRSYLVTLTVWNSISNDKTSLFIQVGPTETEPEPEPEPEGEGG